MLKSRKKVSESILIIILSIWNSIIKLIKFNNPREKISKFKILSLFYIYRSYLIQNLFLASRIFESLTSISSKIGASNESLVGTPLRATDRQKSGIWADVRTCGEEIAHALAMLQMQVQRCTCTHLGVHHRTNVSSARMHRRQVASLCKWELNGMLVGMQDSSLQGAQCIIELRTLRCNGWAWRFRDPLSLSLSLHPFFLYSRFLHVLVERRQRHGPNEGVSFLPRHLAKNESLCHLDDQTHSTIIRQPRGSINSMIRDDVGI